MREREREREREKREERERERGRVQVAHETRIRNTFSSRQPQNQTYQ